MYGIVWCAIQLIICISYTRFSNTIYTVLKFCLFDVNCKIMEEIQIINQSINHMCWNNCLYHVYSVVLNTSLLDDMHCSNTFYHLNCNTIRNWYFVTRLTRRVSLVKQELLTPPEHLISPSVFSGVRVTRSLVFCVVFCRSLHVLLYFSFWPLCCLFFDLRIPITPLVSSISSLSNKW